MRIFVTGATGFIGSAVVAELIAAGHQVARPPPRSAARAFRLAVESAPAGSVLHATDDDGVPVRAIAETIGRHLGLPVTSIAAEDAYEHFGWIGPLFSLDAPATSIATRELLGWQPTHSGLLDDLDAGHYFEEAAVETD